jgi:hypothetical protein
MAFKQVILTNNLKFIIAKERKINCLQRMALQMFTKIASKNSRHQALGT